LTANVIDDLLGLDVVAILDGSGLQASDVVVPSGGRRRGGNTVSTVVEVEGAQIADQEAVFGRGGGADSDGSTSSHSSAPSEEAPATVDQSTSEDRAMSALIEKGVLKP